MNDIASLITLCKTVLTGGSKIVEAYRRKRLCEEEKELLQAAAQNGEFYLPSTDQTGDCVRAGGKDFVDEADPAFAAKYLDAFRSLCERGYINPKGGRLFMLTRIGFKEARQLAQTS